MTKERTISTPRSRSRAVVLIVSWIFLFTHTSWSFAAGDHSKESCLIQTFNDILSSRLRTFPNPSRLKNAELEVKAVQFIEHAYAVHATDTYPGDGIIHSGLENHEDHWFSRSRTIHFATTELVPPHGHGSWESKKFAVLVPLKEVLPGAVNFFAQDTAYLGNFKIPPDSVLLVPRHLQLRKKGVPYSVVEYDGTLREAVAAQMAQRSSPVAKMEKGSGVDGDVAFWNGININSDDFFKYIKQKYPHLALESAMESPFHGQLEAIDGLTDELKKEAANHGLSISASELGLIISTCDRKLKQLRSRVENLPTTPQNKNLFLSTISMLEQRIEALTHIKTNQRAGIDYMDNLEILSQMNRDLTPEQFLREIKKYSFSAEQARGLQVSQLLSKYLSSQTSDSDAKKLLPDLNLFLDQVDPKKFIGLDEVSANYPWLESAIAEFLSPSVLDYASRLNLRDPRLRERFEKVLNHPKLEQITRKALRSLSEDYLHGAPLNWPVSLRELYKKLPHTEQ